MTVSYGTSYCIPNPEIVFQINLTFLLDCLGIPAEGSERTGHTSANSGGGVLPPIDNTYYYTPPASVSRLAGGHNPSQLPPPPLSNAAASTSTIWSLARLTSLQQASATAAVPGAEMAAFSPTDSGQQPLLVNGNAIDLQLKVGRVISCGFGGRGGGCLNIYLIQSCR